MEGVDFAVSIDCVSVELLEVLLPQEAKIMQRAAVRIVLNEEGFIVWVMRYEI